MGFAIIMFKKIILWYRTIFRRCLDCGVKLTPDYGKGDVCSKCFGDFNGVFIHEIL